MLNRWIGIVCAFGMLSVNAALIFRDFVPDWIAGPPPDSLGTRLNPGGRDPVQIGIYDAKGALIGQSWTVCSASTELFRINTWTMVRSVPLPTGVRTPAIRVDTDAVFKPSGAIDTLEIRVHGFGVPVHFKGELIPPDSFPCEWEVGDQRGRLILDADTTRALGDVFRPFDQLPGMYVGRAWRLKLFNPLARLLPGWKGSDAAVESVLVRCTALDTIRHGNREVEAYRVEAPKTRAWVAYDGRVLKQEVDLPLFGRLTLLDEIYDEALRKRRIQEYSPLD